jgi:virginiamycin B lyase
MTLTWTGLGVALLCGVLAGPAQSAEAPVAAALQRPITDLRPAAMLKIGKTADWVAIAPSAVWVAGTGPNAVSRIDPATNQVTDVVALPGEPCAGLALGWGSLWVPLCAEKPALARIDLATRKVTAVFPVGPPASEGGIAVGGGSVWLVTDKQGSLARIDPRTGRVRQVVKIAAGSFNPISYRGEIYVSQVDGALVTSVDAASGRVLATVAVGPHPRFLTGGGGRVWTLNQGDGSLSAIDVRLPRAWVGIPLGTPGHGGDIAFARGGVWTTMFKVPLTLTDARSRQVKRQWTGPGGDSIGISRDAIWLTDYHAGTVSRIPLVQALAP